MGNLLCKPLPVWPKRSKKLGTKKTKTKGRRKLGACSIKTAIGILGANRVFNETHCSKQIKPQAENITLLGGKTIPVAASLLREARRTACLFYIPSRISIETIIGAHPEMFGDLSGLIPEILTMESDDRKPWNWVAVSKHPSFDPPTVLLLIETVYAHVVHRLSTKKNLFKSNVVICYVEPDRSAVGVFFSDEGVVSVPIYNITGHEPYAIGKML